MYKIGIIGDKDSIIGFLSVGFEIAPAENPQEAKAALKKLSEECAVIYIIESLAMEIEDVIDSYRREALPAIIIIPGKEGSMGYGINAVKNSVVRAIGTDIIFNEQGK